MYGKSQVLVGIDEIIDVSLCLLRLIKAYETANTSQMLKKGYNIELHLSEKPYILSPHMEGISRVNLKIPQSFQNFIDKQSVIVYKSSDSKIWHETCYVNMWI